MTARFPFIDPTAGFDLAPLLDLLDDEIEVWAPGAPASELEDVLQRLDDLIEKVRSEISSRSGDPTNLEELQFAELEATRCRPPKPKR
ncbi:hypothetical protein [Blastochloris sulfoviridis]|uniref:Uncharacterized protein n=1 Tax=Blastochloris sulfoviridis TaxID=50712 RepID=A0A5M6HTS8_9HYPH|nr:hypothetical protein [Blastochloris sulfoviridis]KAA5599231.1 hypothetical protein F1193_12425 [Blastochloris sulfoviridis]